MKEKLKGNGDSAKKRLHKAQVLLVDQSFQGDPVKIAYQVLESFMHCEQDTFENIVKKLQTTTLQLNASVNVLKAKSFPLLPRIDAYHPLSKNVSSASDSLKQLGRVWTDLTFLCALMDSCTEIKKLKAKLLSCLDESMFKQPNVGSTQPNTSFGLGIVSNFCDWCCFHTDGLIDGAALDRAESCTIQMLTSLTDSGLLHLRSLQEILQRLLDEPQTLCHRQEGAQHQLSDLLQKFVARCLRHERFAKDHVYFVQMKAFVT